MEKLRKVATVVMIIFVIGMMVYFTACAINLFSHDLGYDYPWWNVWAQRLTDVYG